MRKMTATRITINDDEFSTWTFHEKITCEAVEGTSGTSKVWKDVETGEQYGLTRMCGKYYFFHI